jgi:hypothetical protein
MAAGDRKIGQTGQRKNLFLDPPQPPPTRPPPATWEQLDEAARLAALGVLARLIARMLAAAPAKENDHE